MGSNIEISTVCAYHYVKSLLYNVSHYTRTKKKISLRRNLSNLTKKWMESKK